MANSEYSLFAWKKMDLFFVGIVLILLFAVSRTQLTVGQIKTRDAQRKADVELVARALGNYYGDYEVFPAATGSGMMVSCGDKGEDVCEWGNSTFVDVENVVYLKQVPTDPLSQTGRQYVYQPSADHKKFRIYVALEYNRDPAWKNDLTSDCGNNVQCNWYVEN